MWTCFYSPFLVWEKKTMEKKSCAFQCKFSPFWLWFPSYELLYIVNCNMKFFGWFWSPLNYYCIDVQRTEKMRTAFSHSPATSFPLISFFKVFYSPSLAPGRVASSAFVCVFDALDCPGSELEVCTDLPFFCLLVSDCNILAIGFWFGHSGVYLNSLVYISYDSLYAGTLVTIMCIGNRFCVCFLPGQLFFVTPVVDCL